MSFWKILLLIGVITMAILIIMTFAAAIVIAGRESSKEDKDDGEIH